MINLIEWNEIMVVARFDCTQMSLKYLICPLFFLCEERLLYYVMKTLL